MPAVQRVYRILSQGCFERLEPDIGKLICPVLRGGVVGNAVPLLDTMKLTVLDQYGKGLVQCEAVLGEGIREKIERLKWSLWHGQVDKALGKVDDLESSIAPFSETYARYIYGPARAVKGSRMDQHASGQRQSYIRPLGEDLLWSSGPDAICASSPDHDRGLTGPVPTQVGRKPV